MSMDTWFPNPHDKDIAQLEEGLAYRAIKSGNNWILPSGKNAANGDPVVLDGVFGYATAAIVGGTDAIVEDTNWKPYGDGGALGAISSKMPSDIEWGNNRGVDNNQKVSFSRSHSTAPDIIIANAEAQSYTNSRIVWTFSWSNTGFYVGINNDGGTGVASVSLSWIAIWN